MLPKNRLELSDILYKPQINNNTVTDTLSVKLSGEKVQKQKQLVLCNLEEVHIKLKETHPDIAISFSKCSGLLERPKCCFLFCAYGTHTMFVYNSSKYETYDARCS
jgi:hypothetical protein